MKKFTILGEVRPKKNSRVTNTKTGRTFPSPVYTKWHKSACEQIMLQKQGFHIDKCKIVFKFYHGDLVKRDSDNGTSSVFDTLVDQGIIPDDNWMVVPKFYVTNDLDRSNPRVEVYIYSMDERIDFAF